MFDLKFGIKLEVTNSEIELELTFSLTMLDDISSSIVWINISLIDYVERIVSFGPFL